MVVKNYVINLKQTKMNKINLQKMADHIKTIPQELFSMSTYRNLEVDYVNIECGSIGCVVGHCVQLDHEPEKIPRLINDNINFAKWSGNFTSLGSDEWDWCFSAEWHVIDNTPIGASKRIEYLINHGLPENWMEQMNNRTALCYNFKAGDKIIWDSGFGYEYGEIVRYQTEPVFDNCNVLTIFTTGINTTTPVFRPEIELLIDNENNRSIIKNKYHKN